MVIFFVFLKLIFSSPEPSGSQGELHYANMPMLYTALFHGNKNDNFHMKDCDIFYIFAQNIICGYTLDPPQ